jgi:hypothetical protein
VEGATEEEEVGEEAGEVEEGVDGGGAANVRCTSHAHYGRRARAAKVAVAAAAVAAEAAI